MGRLLAYLLLPVLLFVPTLLVTEAGAAQKGENAIVAIDVQNQPTATTIKMVTREPVGYRYTVYDSFDPVRVVVDFPGMDVSAVGKAIAVKNSPVKEVRASSFDLTSGKLGRVELMLTATTKYQVSLEGTSFQIRFDKSSGKEASALPATATGAKAAVSDTGMKPVAPLAAKAGPAPAPTPAANSAGKPVVEAAEPAVASPVVAAVPKAARWLQSLTVEDHQAVIHTDGRVKKYHHFKLGSPPRLVVDLYGIHPRIKERTISASGEFKQIRIGTTHEKTRLVFDANGKVLPQFTLVQRNDDLIVSWEKGRQAGSTAGQSKSASGKGVAGFAPTPAVKVKSVNFDVKNGKSLLTIDLSGPAKLIPAAAKGTTVGFGIRNATISRALRRTLDASAFPSAVKRVTPYTVLVGNRQDVRFAVEMKGTTDYSLTEEGAVVVLSVDNKGFSQQPAAPSEEVRPVPIPAAAAAAPGKKQIVSTPAAPVGKKKPAAENQTMAAGIEAATGTQPTGGVVGASSPKIYTGQKITLVFDDANILNILQLIAEVSNLNIITSDDVKGTITLRLVDVPWDQALDLIMDIKDLGMVRQGNVIRIMPKEKLRAMDEARMNASRTREKLEDLETELITVNYADLKDVSKHVQAVLTKDRDGVSVSEDARNKQLIVRDIPSNLVKIKELVHKLDTPERQVMIEARIVEATSTFSRDLGVKWGFSSEGEHRAAELGNNQFNLGLGGSFLISPPAAGEVLSSAGAAAGFTFGKIGSTSLDLRLSALEASGEGKVISTPRISTLNGGQATISQGTKIPYQSSGTEGAKTEFVDANLELKVTPVINPDNSMILDINATDSSIGSNVNTGLQGTAPAIDTREAKTKLLVRDGETTVIGGIFVESDTNSTSGVPWLKDLPLIGHLFESTNNSNQRAELLIFITPHIVE